MSDENKYHGYKSSFDFPVTNKQQLYSYHIDLMFNRASQMFRYINLPETIPERVLKKQLIMNGYTIFAKATDGKLYAVYGGLGGQPDVYFRPTEAIIANPAKKFKSPMKLNEECIVVPNDSSFRGLFPLFSVYAQMITENTVSMNLSSIVSRLQMVMTASDDRTKISAESFLKKIVNGEFGCIADNKLIDENSLKVIPSSLGTNSITQLIELQQYLKSGYLNDIGVRANYNMKREALNSNETSMDDHALMPLVDDMFNTQSEALDRVNAMFRTDIRIEKNSVWEEVESDGNEENDQ